MVGGRNYWREDSIKTRIETADSLSRSEAYTIEEKIPLKQGLKLVVEACGIYYYHIEEKIPLKQGLKPDVLCSDSSAEWIEEKIPLKQGLKLISSSSVSLSVSNWREDSIKTRIETN